MIITNDHVFFYTKEDALSNFAPVSFSVKKIHFKTGEHYLHYCKAKLFGDEVRAELILTAKTPHDALQQGRQVVGFDDVVWSKHARNYMTKGCYYKAIQNPEVLSILMDSENRVIGEASANTRWAIGLTMDSDLKNDENAWHGANWLGEAWMEARTIIEKTVPFVHDGEYPVPHQDTIRLCKCKITHAFKVAASKKQDFKLEVFFPEYHEDFDAIQSYIGKPAIMITKAQWEAGVDVLRGIENDCCC